MTSVVTRWPLTWIACGAGLSRVASQHCLKPVEPVVLQPAGWKEESEDVMMQLANIECDIDRVVFGEDVDAAAFFNQYSRRMRPALIRGIATNWPAFSHWSRSYVQSQLGETLLRAGSSRQTAQDGEAQNDMTIMDLLSDEKGVNIVFDHNIFDPVEDTSWQLQADFPRTFAPLNHFTNSSHLTLSIGGTGTGLTFHKHEDAWLALLAGRKRWFLYDADRWNAMQESSVPSQHWYVAPVRGTDSHLKGQVDPDVNTSRFLEAPMLRWVREELPSTSPPPLQCVQHPGEVMYVPVGMLHATMNIGETLGVAGRQKGPNGRVLEVNVETSRGDVLNFLCLGMPCPEWTGLS